MPDGEAPRHLAIFASDTRDRHPSGRVLVRVRSRCGRIAQGARASGTPDDVRDGRDLTDRLERVLVQKVPIELGRLLIECYQRCTLGLAVVVTAARVSGRRAQGLCRM